MIFSKCSKNYEGNHNTTNSKHDRNNESINRLINQSINHFIYNSFTTCGDGALNFQLLTINIAPLPSLAFLEEHFTLP